MNPNTDPFNSIDNICNLANECYMLPEANTYPGALASDWNTLWLWEEASSNLYFLNRSTYGVGWQAVAPGSFSTANAFGRKTFIRGAVPGAGCWFSTQVLRAQQRRAAISRPPRRPGKTLNLHLRQLTRTRPHCTPPPPPPPAQGLHGSRPLRQPGP